MQQEVDKDRTVISMPTGNARTVLHVALQEAFQQLKLLQAMYPQVMGDSGMRAFDACQLCVMSIVPRNAFSPLPQSSCRTL